MTTVTRLLHDQSVAALLVAYPNLPPRYYDVLAMVLTGASDNEIAAYLGLTPRTVRTYTYLISGLLGREDDRRDHRWWLKHAFLLGYSLREKRLHDITP